MPGPWRRATGERPDPRLELGDREWLGQIVVGTGVETGHAILDAREGREHQDRFSEAKLAEAAAELEPRNATEDDVEDDEPVGRRSDPIQRVGSVRDDVDRMALVRQRDADRATDGRLVLDDKDLHVAWSFMTPGSSRRPFCLAAGQPTPGMVPAGTTSIPSGTFR